MKNVILLLPMLFASDLQAQEGIQSTTTYFAGGAENGKDAQLRPDANDIICCRRSQSVP